MRNFLILSIALSGVVGLSSNSFREGELICAGIEKSIRDKAWSSIQKSLADEITIFVSADGPEVTFYRSGGYYSKNPKISLEDALFNDTAMRAMNIKAPAIRNMLLQNVKRDIYWEPELNEPDSRSANSSTLIMYQTKEKGFAIYFKKLNGTWKITGVSIQEFLTNP